MRYYQRLFGWAFHLTGGPRARAEDLLHDAFIQFALCRPDLTNINNVDSYLYRLLLNLFLAQKRKAAQMQDLSLNITNYDSAELGLNAIDFQARLQAREDLLRISHYACVRKETSRAGSVLILRFFYDYSPSEIARVFLSQRRAVDDWLRIARREARLYLEDPARLKFMAGEQGRLFRFKTRLTESSDDIMRELQASILRSCQGSCPSKALLRALYQDSDKVCEDKTADCRMLAHIVSCASCLDQVNQLLGLPLLSARHLIGKGNSDSNDSDDDSDKDDTDGGGGGTGVGVGPSKAFIDRCRGQLRQVMEHRPEELRFSANGFPIGALKINSELSELQLSIHEQSPVDFIEVFSERGVRLILFSLGRGEDAPMEQRAQIELSEDRTLELIFKLGSSWPSLRVIYHDPLLQEARLAPNDAQIGALALIRNDGSSHDDEEHGSARWLLRLWRRLNSGKAMLSVISAQSTTQGMFKTEPATGAPTAPEDKDSRYEEPRIFELGRAQDLIRGPLWARTRLITALFSVMLIGALLYLWSPGAKPVNAAGLLERARNAEEELYRDPGVVQHRTLDFEERIPNGGSNAVIARRQIEIWHVGATRLRVRRLYDERRRLTAGEWRRADGSLTIYRRGIRPQTMADNNHPFTLEDLWRIEPSAQNFITLVGRVEAATVAEQPDIYLLNYEDSTSKPARSLGIASEGTQLRVLRITLTLRKSDLRAIDQMMLVDVGGDNPQLREFHFHESGFEGHPAEKVQPETFEPEPE
ncbi:MAG: hypothetical protein J2P21_21565, partial [Chloracidobacterium sp.]|nr:hypothetical protein [Chloracidobacterium sp.]